MYGLSIYHYKAWEQLTQTYGAPPLFIDKPGRDLSQEEARDIVMHLVVKKEIQLIDPPLFGAKGVQIPKPGQRLRISNQVAGVTYQHPTLHWDYLPDVNLAWIVVLYRLARGLRDQFGVHKIYWRGIGRGADDKPKTDSHHSGRAIDFFGAETRFGKVTVTQDWSKQPIVINGKTEPDWKPTQIPHYRLLPIIRRGYFFFLWVYGFATRECQDYSQGPSIDGKGPTTIGMHSFIIHPDHPNRRLRSKHQDHMHFQIGTT